MPPPKPPTADRALRRWPHPLRQWWLRRLRPSDTLLLTHRNLYILPTRAGLMLGVTLLLLLVASINYQLNLGYLLTFLLTGCAVVALHLTHRNLRGLTVHLPPTEPVFTGQEALLRVRLHNPSRHTRYGVGLSVLHAAGQPAPEPAWADIDAGQFGHLELRWRPQQRGPNRLPPLLVQTRFPLGTTRAWHWWQPAATGLAYPAPEPQAPPLPLGQGSGEPGARAPSVATASLDWDGTRPYRSGDPLKRVLWRKAARSAEGPAPQWVVRDSAPPPNQTLWLDARLSGLADTEAMLSRLCTWVLDADRRGLHYGLRLPGLEIAPGDGDAHRLRCLKALACH